MLGLVAEITSDSNTTGIVVTHTVSDARLIAEQTFFIDNGKAEMPVRTNELLENPTPALKQYLRKWLKGCAKILFTPRSGKTCSPFLSFIISDFTESHLWNFKYVTGMQRVQGTPTIFWPARIICLHSH